jgi:hypothetical protein
VVPYHSPLRSSTATVAELLVTDPWQQGRCPFAPRQVLGCRRVGIGVPSATEEDLIPRTSGRRGASARVPSSFRQSLTQRSGIEAIQGVIAVIRRRSQGISVGQWPPGQPAVPQQSSPFPAVTGRPDSRVLYIREQQVLGSNPSVGSTPPPMVVDRVEPDHRSWFLPSPLNDSRLAVDGMPSGSPSATHRRQDRLQQPDRATEVALRRVRHPRATERDLFEGDDWHRDR